jgi:ABC-type nitrate/sulfonate/bicarbonate transport system permease component
VTVASHRLLGALGLAAAAGLWEAVSRSGLVPSAYMPPVEAIVRALATMIATHGLVQTDVLTLGRAVFGWCIAVVIALTLALASAYWRVVRQALAPPVDVLRGLPPAALVPLAIYYLGQGGSLYLTIIVFAAVWPAYIGAMSGLAHVDRVLVDSGTALGRSRAEVLLQIKLPAAMPELFTGLRLAAGFSLMGTVVAEMLAGSNGIGYTIYDAAFTLHVPETFAALVVIGIDGIAISGALLLVRGRLLRWHVRLTAARTMGVA